MKSVKLIRLVIVMVTLTMSNARALAPQLIKNTVLLETKQKLPVWLTYGIPFGMVFIETHIVENYIRYAPEKTATSKLLRELFNIKTGEFRIPDSQINIAGNYINLKMMGKIIRLIFESAQAGKKILSDELESRLKPEIRRAFKEKYLKLNDKFSESHFSSSFRSSFKRFSTSLRDSLEECNYWGDNKTPIYAPHTTLYLLYGFIYKKALDRADLKRFFDTLCGEDFGLQKDLEQYFPNQIISLNKSVLDNANPSREKNWLIDSYDLRSIAKQAFELPAPSELEDTPEFLDVEKLLVTGLAQNWFEFDMPPMIDYGWVTSKKYPGSAEGSDCVRTAIRSICNILAFDQDTQLFSANTLLKSAPGAVKELQKFYSTYPGKRLPNQTIAPYTAADLQSDELRTVWSDDVIKTNIPYATYVELYTKTGLRVKAAPKVKGPFAICLPDNSSLLKNKSTNKDGFYEGAVTIGDTQYDAFMPSSGLLGLGFAPYTHTLIFALDHILGLKLFNGVKIDEELVKPDFEKIYMEKLSHVPPFEKIVSQIGVSTGTHDVTTNRGQNFHIGLQNGLHAYVKSIGIARSGGKVWEKLIKNKGVAPEIMLFLSHALNVNPDQPSILGQSYLLRGNWFLNVAKTDAIERIADYLQLEKTSIYYEDKDYFIETLALENLKSSWDVSDKGDDTCNRDDKDFYLQVIKNILASFNFTVGDIDLCLSTIKVLFRKYFLHNRAFKEIVFGDVRNKLLAQTADTRDNTLMVVIKSGSLEEVKKVTSFIKESRNKQLKKQLCKQTNKKGETALLMAKMAKKMAKKMGNGDSEVIGDIKDEIDYLC